MRKYQIVYLEHHPELNGVIPKGYHIHHKDKNRNNNDISNLEMMLGTEHNSMHSTGQSSGHKSRNPGKLNGMWNEPTQQMIDDILSGIKCGIFCKKYSCHNRIYHRTKRYAEYGSNSDEDLNAH